MNIPCFPNWCRQVKEVHVLLQDWEDARTPANGFVRRTKISGTSKRYILQSREELEALQNQKDYIKLECIVIFETRDDMRCNLMNWRIVQETYEAGLRYTHNDNDVKMYRIVMLHRNLLLISGDIELLRDIFQYSLSAWTSMFLLHTWQW